MLSLGVKKFRHPWRSGNWRGLAPREGCLMILVSAQCRGAVVAVGEGQAVGLPGCTDERTLVPPTVDDGIWNGTKGIEAL